MSARNSLTGDRVEADVLGLIPARGGSKGVPRKNIRSVAGKPLLVWTIEAAKRARRIGRVVVSTEDSEIADVARANGAEVLVRPDDLATDEASTVAVVQHAIGVIPAGVVVVLQPTSPIRRDGLIDACVEKFLAEAADSLGTVHRDYSYEYGEEMPRRQEMRPRLVDNGNVYVLRADVIRSGRWLGARRSVFETTKAEGVEIDDAYDLWLANRILEDRTPVEFR